MNKHTPGPWKAYKNGNVVIIGGGCVATVHKYCAGRASVIPGVPMDVHEEEVEANAKLISAAPELLEALQCLMSRVAKDAESYAQEGNEPIWAFIEDANDAICKAKGEGN